MRSRKKLGDFFGSPLKKQVQKKKKVIIQRDTKWDNQWIETWRWIPYFPAEWSHFLRKQSHRNYGILFGRWKVRQWERLKREVKQKTGEAVDCKKKCFCTCSWFRKPSPRQTIQFHKVSRAERCNCTSIWGSKCSITCDQSEVMLMG